MDNDQDKPIFSTTIEGVARVSHEINAAYCRSLGDNSQPSWTDLSQELKETSMAGVLFHLHNPLATPEDSHESWMLDKETKGWVYGEVKDEEKKEHPCMLPYDELPPEQRAKDYLFKQVVESIKPFIGM